MRLFLFFCLLEMIFFGRLHQVPTSVSPICWTGSNCQRIDRVLSVVCDVGGSDHGARLYVDEAVCSGRQPDGALGTTREDARGRARAHLQLAVDNGMHWGSGVGPVFELPTCWDVLINIDSNLSP